MLFVNHLLAATAEHCSNFQAPVVGQSELVDRFLE
jgi:hypothetical protein